MAMRNVDPVASSASPLRHARLRGETDSAVSQSPVERRVDLKAFSARPSYFRGAFLSNVEFSDTECGTGAVSSSPADAVPLTAVILPEPAAAQSNSNMKRLWAMFFLTASFMVVELAVGFTTNSLALITDAFHMISDTISIAIGMYALKASQKSRSEAMSYGYARAAVLGALINGVFLVALVFTIVLDSIKRFVEIEEINNPVLLIIVASAGLGVNVLGLLIFGGHAHHGHSHGHKHDHEHDNAHDHEHEHEHEHDHEHDNEHKHGDPGECSDHPHADAVESRNDRPDEPDHHHAVNSHSHGHAHGKEGSMNMHGVFLHVLGDALGSIAALVGGLIIWLTDSPGRFYADPCISVAVSLLILYTSVPLVRNAVKILMQGVPAPLNLDTLRAEILQIPNVCGVHCLHVWQLSEESFVGSAHVLVHDALDVDRTVDEVVEVFQKFGVQSATIQPLVMQERADECLNCQPQVLDADAPLLSAGGTGEEVRTVTLKCRDKTCEGIQFRADPQQRPRRRRSMSHPGPNSRVTASSDTASASVVSGSTNTALTSATGASASQSMPR